MLFLPVSQTRRGGEGASQLALASRRCEACHAITPQARSEVADAPPFDAIGRKFGFDSAAISLAISGPHQKMNFSPARRDAVDLAAYIAGLDR